jgi:UDP-N-acetylglucosamine 2-epimerase (non-hydrolysing)
MKIINVVGARPNFIKIAPLIREMDKHSHLEKLLVHTGQHYDDKMSEVFFKELSLPKPDIYLGVGSRSHVQQIAHIMTGFEEVCLREKPNLIIVVGDVNSTLACSLVAAKLGICLAHVEAGLRSFDRGMPEETNRILTDHLSDFLFTTSLSANENLQREGISPEKIFFVGNVMIDTLLRFKKYTQKDPIMGKKPYCLLTLHRPENVDSPEILARILQGLSKVGENNLVLFPMHPRTQKNIEQFGYKKHFQHWCIEEAVLANCSKGLASLASMSYLGFLNLMAGASIVFTDSGGVQEETTILGVPCLTLRSNTERPITVTQGTNEVIGIDSQAIIEKASAILNRKQKSYSVPALWDGHAAGRIVSIILDKM